MVVRRIPYITVRVPSYSRNEDRLEEREVECEVRGGGDWVELVPRDARPTAPFLVKLNPNDLLEAMRS